MSTDINNQKNIHQHTLINEELYRVFVMQSSEGIWRFELEEPVSISLPPAEQLERFYRFGYLAECNPAMARMYGYGSPQEITGARLGDFLVREDEANIRYLRAFIDSNYRLEGAESHEIDRRGNLKFFINNLIGIVEDGFLKRAWGTQRDVTERRETERSRAHLAAIVESSDDAVVSKDLNGIIMSWNKGAEKIFGYASQEVIGKSITILIPSERLSEEQEILGRVRKGREVKHYETVRRRRDGELIDVSLTVSPIKDEAGKIIGASKIARDITASKRSEEFLRQSQTILALSMQSSRMGFWTLDLTKDAVWWSPELEQIFGLKEGAFGGTQQAFFDFIDEADREAARREIARATAEHRDYTIEFRFRRADGSRRWMEGRGRAVYAETGEPLRLYGIGMDVTERKRAEKAMRDSEEKFAKAFNSSPLVLTITSLVTGKLIEVNDTFVRLTGFTREETIGRTTAELGLWANPEERADELAAVASQGEIRDLEYVFRLKNGTEIIGLLSAELLELRGERCALTVIQDITERKKAEKISARYRLLSERARDIILFLRPDGQIIDANQMAIETYGYAQEELLRMNLRSLRAPETLSVLEQQLAKANDGGVLFETVHICKDGSMFPVEVASIGAHIGGERLLISIIRDITERRKNEEMIRESEEQLRQMADAMPQVVWIADANGVVQYYNNRVSEFFGIRQTAAGSWAWEPVIHEADLPSTVREWQKATRKKSVYAKEHRIKMADGAYRWHLSRAVPVLDAKGEILKWFGTATDIDDIKQTEEALRESEKRFRTMTNNAPMLVWMNGAHQEYTYFNQTWLDFTGRTMEEELGGGWTKGIHREDLTRFSETSVAAFKAREEFEMEYRLRRFDGEYRWILDKGVPLFTHNGTFLGYIGSCIDVTDRKQAQEKLLLAERRASEEYLELLSRIVPLAQVLGTARDLSSVYRALHEFVRASMPCSSFFVSFYDAARSLRTAAFVWGEEGEVDISKLPPLPLTPEGGPNSQAIFQNKSVVVNRYWELTKTRPHLVLQENGRIPNSSLVVPMRIMNRLTGTLEVQAYEENAFTKEHIIALEMAANLAAVAIENVRLLQVEAEARETAEAANRAKDEFLSVLSHELRTPLNSMLGWTRMLRGGALDAEKTRKAIEVIERNTMLQNSLIEDLLDVSRIISGKMRIEKETIDLVKIFIDTIELLRPVAAQKFLVFEARTREKSLIIEGDATRIHQIIVNLVQNAVKFTEQGGQVSVSLARTGATAQIVVKDTGIGISEDLLPFIFERFRQADSSTRREFSGLGLGLTLVHNLVELHGGTIEAASAGSGQGATFTVEIPLSRYFSGELQQTRNAVPVESGNAVLAGAQILLVDDDAEALYPLQLFLEREKAEVVTAVSVEEALEKISAQNFHILITDIGMPFADGYDLLSRARELGTEPNRIIKAIALTAYASADDRRRALASGFEEHFAKPVDYDELLQTIKRIYEKIKSKDG